MNKLKAGLVTVTGLAIGVVTLRSIRKRRTNPRDEAKTAAKEALGEAKEAADHADSAVKHARVAGQKTREYANEEFEARSGAGAADLSESTSRLRKVGKSWIRR